eukprot:11218643-Lingulodinium_polyedra.AAC.1
MAYCQALFGGPDWTFEVGSAAATTPPKGAMEKLGGSGDPGQYHSDQVKLGGVLGMLDVTDRVKPVSDMAAGRV